MTLLQCIKCARWPTDHPLSIFPGVQHDLARNETHSKSPQLPHLIDIPRLSSNALSKLMDQLSVPNSERSQFIRATSMLPLLNLHVPDPSAIEINVSITRQNAGGTSTGRPSRSQDQPTLSEFRVWAPHFPKPQTEGFFVIVADEPRDEIVALKRVTWPPVENRGDNEARDTGHSTAPKKKAPSNPSIRTVLKIPPNSQPRKLDVFVISDAYIGMQWRVKDGVHVPGAPTFDNPDDGKKKAKSNEAYG